MEKYVAEFLGTFALSSIVALSIHKEFGLATPILAALTLMLFVYSVGHISGAHLNPAVTIGAFSLDKIKLSETFGYLAVQFLGAIAALILLKSYPGKEVTFAANNSGIEGFAEFFGTFIFTFGVAAVMYGKVPSHLNGIVVGGSLLLGIAFASFLGSNAMLNPAVAFSVGSFDWMYIFGPIIGAIAGMNVYKFLKK
ncbi:MAG: aquaporin [Candidatus Paceibacterota bacterium]|jgi:glycerol uptake facilitator-like aquaporin